MLTSDPYIIAALYTKYKIHEYEKSDSSSIQVSDLRSVPCDVSKDEVSYTGDNETPVSNVLKSNQKSSPSGEVKRNLHDVYDVDDTLGCSATKRRVSEVACVIKCMFFGRRILDNLFFIFYFVR